MITMRDAVTTSIGAIVGARIRPVACPKLNVIFEMFSPRIIPKPKATTYDGAGESQAKAFHEKQRKDLPRQRSDRRDRADLSDALIDCHDHDVENADQDNRNEHQLDEERHHVDHIGDVGEGRELRPRMNFDAAALLLFLSQAEPRPYTLSDPFHPGRDFTRTAISLTSLPDIRRISLASSKWM